MKIWISILCLISAPAWAFDPYEDTPENLAPQVENNRSAQTNKARQGTWVYAFELMLPDGTSQVISESNRSVLVKPASTIKLFTGWYAFKKGFRTNKYLGTMLKQSSNPMADSTLKAMGGARALRTFFAGEGLTLNNSNFIQADGSGLSYNNKTNCSVQIDLLKLIYRDPGYQDYKALMALPGEEGTLKTRLLSLQGNLAAKTGTLKRTAALTGFVETKSGTLLFCVLTDYLPAASAGYRPRIDKMVTSTVESLNL